MTEKKETPQEIDLIELFTNIGNWLGEKLKWLYKIGLHIFYYLIRNSPWFALSIVIGAIFGYYNYQVQTSKPFYKTNIIGNSFTISSDEIVQMVSNWDYSSGFDAEDLLKIRKVEASFLLDKNDDGQWDLIESDLEEGTKIDTAIMNQRLARTFCIQSEVFDTTIIPKLRTKVLDLITKNERVIKLNTIRLQQKTELIPKIQKEFAELDSLKNIEYFEKEKVKSAKVGEILLVAPRATQLYHNELLSLYRQQQALESELFLYTEPIEITLEYTKNTNEALKGGTRNDNMLNYIKKFLLLGFILVLVIDRRKYIFDQIRRSKEDNIE
jgi:hypothetical protein